MPQNLSAEATASDPAALVGVTWAQIDLDAIAHNVRGIKALIGPEVAIIAVVKADAYGHGAIPVARVVLESGATRLAVHRLAEGIQLRQAGIAAPILVMGHTLPAEAGRVVQWDVIPTVNERSQAEALAAATDRVGKRLAVHVKIDSGMGRWGQLPHEAVAFCEWLHTLRPLELEGVYTHFAVADEASESAQAYTRCQLEIYLEVLHTLAARGIDVPLRHAANSAATLTLPDAHLDAVRPGIALCGMSPSADVSSPFPLKPAMTLKSRVVRLRTLPPGSSVGYGRTFVTQAATRVALVAVGYGDGYQRCLSNRSLVLVRGQRAPVRGRISMDQTVIDVSHIPGVELGDEVVFFGGQSGPWGEAAISAAEVANWAETLNYEVTTRLASRVTRVYLRHGQLQAIHRLDGSVSAGE